MVKRGRSDDPLKAQRWRELIQRWQASGQTVRTFCRSTRVRESAFYWWKRRLAGRPGDRPLNGSTRGRPKSRRADVRATAAGRTLPQAPRFLPVQVVLNQAAGSGVEIHWDNGRTVRLGRGFDRQTLEQGTFRFPTSSDPQTRSIEISSQELSLVLWGIDPASVKRQPRYQRPA